MTTHTPTTPQPPIGDDQSAIRLPSQWWRALADQAQPRKPGLKGLDLAWDVSVGAVQRLVPRRTRVLRRAARIVEQSRRLEQVSDAELADYVDELRARFARGRDRPIDLDRALALLREVAYRQLGLRPYPEQVAAALAIHMGCVIELATGEGKTLAAALAATVIGWRGRGCHVVTVNDYLAKRDAEWMRPVYRFCQVNVAHVENETPPPQRRAAYGADVTYLTNREAAADFLRDRLTLGGTITGPVPALLDAVTHGVGARHGGGGGPDRLVMRGLECAIVDEADSVLIDEAVTPLIIASPTANEQEVEAYARAAQLAAQLDEKTHYRIDHRYREVRLTNAGRAAASELCQHDTGVWRSPRRREELIAQALTARHLFIRGKHYVIHQPEGASQSDEQDKIVIVDEFTGRLMPDRTWRHGLHQAVEAKEGLSVNPPKETVARISFQRFFRQYRQLAGMTGTAREATSELWRVYHRPVVCLPPHRPCIRTHEPDRLYATAEEKWQAIVEEIERVHERGRPILAGTRSVEASEHLSALLTRRNLPHVVLNAMVHEEEAQIIAEAGRPGRITVATNMAGRGTDIKLAEGIADRGGLHVIATERHEASRVDRQLFGRAGRQGEPGSAVAFGSLEDELIRRYGRAPLQLTEGTFRDAQQRAGRIAARQRGHVLRTDDWLDEHLGFTARE